ncbi:MAG: type II secretion system F family protein [Bacillota bacterium]|nr:type II secretion system F family protein [Bacillota bacterium]
MKKKLFDNLSLASLCLELSLMLKAGISISEAFLLLEEDEKDRECREVFHRVFRELEQGGELEAVLRETGVFPSYMAAMVGIGQQTGSLESVFRGLAAYYQRQENISSAIRSAVVYPLALFFMVLVVLGVLITEVLPIFNDVFSQLGASLSPAALAFMELGQALDAAKWVLLGFLAALLLLIALSAIVPSLREGFVRFCGRILAGTRLGRKVATARLASAMAMGLAGAMDVDSSLEAAQDLVAGSAVSPQIAECRRLIGEGKSFCEAVSETALFDPACCRMLSIGVRAGAADSVMEEIARRTQEEADQAIDRAVGRAEPILVTVMALVVGLVLLSVMLPLMGVMSSIG